MTFSRWAHQQNDDRPFQLLNPGVEKGRIRIDGTKIFIGNAEPNCSHFSGLHVFTPLDIGSLCPWYWRVDYDPRRIPAAVPVAECACTVVTWGRISFECHPIFYEIRALKFSETNCEKMEEVELRLNVGCVPFRQGREPNPRHTDLNEFAFPGLNENRDS